MNPRHTNIRDDDKKRDLVREWIVRMVISERPSDSLAEIQKLLPSSYDIRKMQFWQEAVQEGREIAIQQSAIQQMYVRVIRRGLAQGRSHSEMAYILGLPLKEVRRLAKEAAK